MLDFAKYLEDSVYCNDRSVIDYGNWASTNNVTGYGMGYETIKFKNYNLNDELYCKILQIDLALVMIKLN